MGDDEWVICAECIASFLCTPSKWNYEETMEIARQCNESKDEMLEDYWAVFCVRSNPPSWGGLHRRVEASQSADFLGCFHEKSGAWKRMMRELSFYCESSEIDVDFGS